MAVSAVKKEPAKPAQAEAAAAAAPAPKSGKKAKLLYAAIGVLVLAGGGGGGAWWYLHRDSGAETHKAEPAKPPVFAPLEVFTVNLQSEDGVPQFVQVGLTLRLTDETAVAALKLRMPEVRDRILLMLSAKKAAELLTLEGKKKLATDIQTAVNNILVPGSAAAAEKAAAAAAKVPAAAPAAPAAPAAAAADAQPEKQQEAQPAPEQAGEQNAAQQEAAPSEPQAAATALPVTGVLFTSFIVQ